MKKPFFSLTIDEFEHLALKQGFGKSALKRLASKINRFELNEIPSKDEEISSELLTYFRELLAIDLPRIRETHESHDGTIKFLVEFKDGMVAEMVAMSFNKKYTLCLSSQIGCAMKCSFCFTGTRGLKRHLSSDEIVGQYLIGRNFIYKNIV